jgi:GntR family transcriptional regulator
MVLEQESAEPLYQQIRNILTGWIHEGKLCPHERIPSERELCEQFNVSRMTVRQALGKLKEDGLIYTRQGKGAFVADISYPFELSLALTGYSEKTASQQQLLSSHILEAYVLEASPKQATTMQLSPGDELVCVKRLRLMREQPIAHQTVYVPHRLCPGLADRDFGSQGVLDFISHEYQIKPVRAEQVVKATLEYPQDIECLQLDKALPMLFLDRKTFLQDGTPIELSRSYYRADSFHLSLTLDLTQWFS